MNDEEIIDLYWNRSEEAIMQTSYKYGSYCKAIAFNVLHNQNDVEECVNDTYYAAWNAIPPNKPDKLKLFLGRLTRNIACDRYDYNKAKKRNKEFDLILSELDEVLYKPEDDVEGQYDKVETSRLINSFLHNIDDETRNIFICRYWYCDSISKIAKRFYCSESKIKSLLFRTRNKLKIFLNSEGVIL